jgi:uncharacterized protein YceK
MKITFLLLAILLTGCSASRVQIHPIVINNQAVTYARGNIKLNSQTGLKPELTILDYSLDEILIGLTVTNTTNESILFSEKNLTVDLVASDKSEVGTVYTFDQLAEEAADEGYDTATQVGSTAAGIGSGFIPFGSIAYSIGRLFYSVGSQSAASHEENIDKLTYTQLNSTYLRQHTLEPEASYSGILKIGFADDIKAGDTIIFTLSAGGEVEKFKFNCQQAKE